MAKDEGPLERLIQCRVDEPTHVAWVRLAKANGLNSSQLIRAIIASVLNAPDAPIRLNRLVTVRDVPLRTPESAEE